MPLLGVFFRDYPFFGDFFDSFDGGFSLNPLKDERTDILDI
jgi:hypothetical protein